MYPRRRFTLSLPGGRNLALGERTLVMGVINVTPDSFSDGGDLFDVGGESTRPGADPLGEEEERSRVLPVIEALARRVTVPISVDTSKASVADGALRTGAAIVNDISGLRYDPALGEVVDRHEGLLVLM